MKRFTKKREGEKILPVIEHEGGKNGKDTQSVARGREKILSKAPPPAKSKRRKEPRVKEDRYGRRKGQKRKELDE